MWDAWKNMMEIGRGGACVPARVALQGRIHRSSPAHHACIFGMETPLRGRSGGHTGAAPTVSFGWIGRGWFCLLVKTVHMNQHHRCCTFASPGLPTIGSYPEERRREKIYAIGIVLFKINFRVGKSFVNNPFAACGNDV